LISWFGGKSSNNFIKDLINPKIPKTGIKTYIEPFSGSFATYMDDPNLKFDNVYFNDKNRHQVNLYKCATEPKKLLRAINELQSPGGLLYTSETDPLKKWDFYKSIYRKYVDNDFLDDMSFQIGDFKKAAIYAFLITSSFSSVYPRGGGFTGYKKNEDKLKLQSLISKLEKNKYTDKLLSIGDFTNDDFEEFILRHDSEETYIYLDPPYYRYDPKTGEDDAKRLYWYGSDDPGVFGPASHRRLLNLIKNCKSRWSLSYYYFPLLEELLPKDQYFWYEKEVFRSSAHGGKNHDSEKVHEKGVELLICNYDPSTGVRIKQC
jgi:site-specific DNA-adenine methylase